MKDGARMDSGNAIPCLAGLRKSQELNLYLLHGLNGNK